MTQETSLQRVVRALGGRQILVPASVLIAVVLGTGLFSPNLLEFSGLMNFLTDAAPLLVLVIGGTLPILLGSIDVSIAGMASVASVLVVLFDPVLGNWSVPAVIATGAAIGALQGGIHAWTQTPSLVVTLGTLGILQGAAMLLTGGTPEALPDTDFVVTWIGASSAGIPNSAFIVLGVVLLLAAFMRFTRLGRDVFATGSAERAARMSGVNTLRVRVLAFMISGACAAMGGVLLLSISTFSSPTLAGNFLLLSILGVLVGGTAASGGVGGLASGVIGGLMTAWFNIVTVVIGVGAEAQNAVFGVLALVAVAFTTDRSKIGVIK
jgi:ribose transport system permease protein